MSKIARTLAPRRSLIKPFINRNALPLLALLLAAPANAETLELKDCRISAGPGMPSIKARCGTMRRPLDPDGSVDDEIELNVAVVPALNLTPEADPIVPIAGGPGQSTVQFYAAYAGAFEPMRRNRDILLVDQRGTGESATMDCDVDDDVAEGSVSTELTIQYMRQCIDTLPHDPRFFTTSVAVRDLEAVRAALGYAALNLYGVSYGSRVAQHFARRFPTSTRSMIIDGVVPPQKALGPEIATESQRAVDNILARCLAEDHCSERFPRIDRTFRRVLDELTAEPVDVVASHPSTGHPEEVEFGRNEFALAIRLLAYSPRSIALLPLLVHEAGEGRYEPLASQYLMTLISLTDALSLGMHNSIMCTEDAPYFEPADIDRDALDASYMGPFQLEALQAICSVWPAGPIDDGFKTPLDTDLPVLVLSGDVDPITPPSWGTLAMIGLGNATHLVGKHQGHGQIAVGCMPEIAADFVETADPQSLDTECMARSFVMPFFIDFSGPSP